MSLSSGFGFLLARVFALCLPAVANMSLSAKLILDGTIAFSSLLPDLVDKPLMLLRITSASRTYGHTLLFLLISSSLAYFTLKKLQCVIVPSEWVAAFSLGVISHLLADCFFGHVCQPPFLRPTTSDTSQALSL